MQSSRFRIKLLLVLRSNSLTYRQLRKGQPLPLTTF